MKFQSFLSKCSSLFSRGDVQQEGIMNLMEELTRLRREVHREFDWFCKNSSGEGQMISHEAQQRLLYLFVKDLSSGVSGDVLSNQVERDTLTASLKLNQVDWIWKYLGWVLVIVLNMGMLLYVYLFAMIQTHSRQSAWFYSFLVWLVFEIFVSSTGLVLLVHILIPLYVLADIRHLKEKVIGTMISFRKRWLDMNGRAKAKVLMYREDFNSAKYLYTSWRVASLLVSESERKFLLRDMILEYSSIWPTRRFDVDEGVVSQEYDQAIILSALGRLLLYFLRSFLHFHVLVQDIILQMCWTSGFGYSLVWMNQMWTSHPSFPMIPILLLLILFVILLFGKINQASEQNLNSMSQPRSLVDEKSEGVSATVEEEHRVLDDSYYEVSSEESKEDGDGNSEISSSSDDSSDFSIELSDEYSGNDDIHIYEVRVGTLVQSSDDLGWSD